MKRLILLAAFTGLVFIPNFSQMFNLITLDTTYKDLSLFRSSVHQNPLNRKAYSEVSNTIMNSGNLLFPDISSFNPLFNKNLGKITYSIYDNMPCIKPEGNFSMLISKPDSTYRYSLIIRKP